MSPEEALNLLNQVAANFQTNRETHVKLQTAVNVLQVAIEQKTAVVPTDKSKK